MEEKEKMDNLEEENDGISISELFTNLKKRWKSSLVIGLVSLVLVSGALIFYSHGKNTYVSTFQTHWNGIGSEQYLNGESFNYTDIVSKDNLLEVKESNEEFANIDIDKMVDKKGIKITSNIRNKIKDNKDSGYIYEYQITVNQKYFKGDKVASKFMQEVVEHSTIDENKQIIDDYKLLNYFDFQRETSEYPEMIGNIRLQTNLQKSVINQLIDQTSSEYVYDKETKQTLGQLLNEIEVFLRYDDFNRFETKIRNQRIVRNIETYKDEFLIRKASIDLTMEQNLKKIEALKALDNKAGQDSIPKMIADLTLENVDLQYEKEYIEECLNSAQDDPALNKEIEEYQDRVIKYNDKIELAYRNVNIPKTVLTFNNNKIIESNGFGTITSVGIGFIFAVFVDFIYVLILTFTKKSKKEIND